MFEVGLFATKLSNELLKLARQRYAMEVIDPITYKDLMQLATKLAQLEAEGERLRELCNDVALGHKDPYDSNYNECDKEPCAWCEEFEALGGDDE